MEESIPSLGGTFQEQEHQTGERGDQNPGTHRSPSPEEEPNEACCFRRASVRSAFLDVKLLAQQKYSSYVQSVERALLSTLSSLCIKEDTTKERKPINVLCVERALLKVITSLY